MRADASLGSAASASIDFFRLRDAIADLPTGIIGSIGVGIYLCIVASLVAAASSGAAAIEQTVPSRGRRFTDQIAAPPGTQSGGYALLPVAWASDEQWRRRPSSLPRHDPRQPTADNDDGANGTAQRLGRLWSARSSLAPAE